jgi:hypothetical protein
MPLFALLRKYFRNVKIQSLRMGYSFLALAEFPALKPFPTWPPARPFRLVSTRFVFPSGGSPSILTFDFTVND